MTFEGGSRGGEKAENGRVQLYMTKDGTHWYRGTDEKVKVLDDAGDALRERQQLEPDFKPTPDSPLFSTRVRRAEIPPEGSRAPEESSDESEPPHPEPTPPSGPTPRPADAPPVAPPTPPAEPPPGPPPPAEPPRPEPIPPGAVNATSPGISGFDFGGFRIDWPTRETGRGLGRRNTRTERVITHRDYPGRNFTNAEYEALARLHREGIIGGLDQNSVTLEDLRRAGYSEQDIRDLAIIRAGGGNQPPQEPPPQNPGGAQNQGPRFGNGGAQERNRTTQGFNWREADARRYVGLTPKSVREIMASPQDSNLFGKLLKNIDEQLSGGVLLRLMDGTTTQADMSFLNAAAKEYAYRQKVVEEVKEKVPQEMEVLARWNPNLGNLVGVEGLPRATEMVKNMVAHMAMGRDPEQGDNFANVESMNEWFKQLSRDRQTHRARSEEKRVRALCQKIGISPLDYNAVFKKKSGVLYRDESIRDRAATADQLTRMFHERAGKFRRAMDFLQTSYPPSVRRPREGRIGRFLDRIQTSPDVGSGIALPGSSRYAAQRALQTADMIEKSFTYHMALSNAVERIDVNLNNIASYLGTTVDNDELLNLVAREVSSNQNQTLASEGGPQTFGQTQQMVRDRYEQGSIETRIRQRMQQNDWPQGNTPDTLAAQDSIIRGMRDTEQREQRGGGLWAWIFRMLFERNWDNAARTTLNRQVNFGH